MSKELKYHFNRFSFFLFSFILIINKSTAQFEAKARVPGYVYPTDTVYIPVITNGNGQYARNSQSVAVADDTDVRVAPTNNLDQQSEVHISIDKNNPQNLILSCNILLKPTTACPSCAGDQGYFYSSNGGSTWTGSDYYPYTSHTAPPYPPVNGDPSTAFDASGNVYVSSLKEGIPDYQDLYNVTSSFPPTWSNPLVTTPGTTDLSGTPNPNDAFDKDMIVVDNFVNSQYINNIYAVGTEFTNNPTCSNLTGNIRFLSNTTFNNLAGGTGSALTTPNMAGLDLRTFTGSATGGIGLGAVVQTGPNGEVYVCWADYPSGSVPDNYGNIGFAYSPDGGNTWANQSNAIMNPYNGGINQFCYSSSETQNNLVNTAFGNDGAKIRMNDNPTMAVDKSCGPYSGRIYVAFPVTKVGGSTNYPVIELSYSDDQGFSWSTPIIISTNTLLNPTTVPQDLGSGPMLHPVCFFPVIAVDDETGIVSVAYHAFDGSIIPPNTSSTYNSTNTYVAYSTDFGATFTNIPVSDVPHSTNPIPGYVDYAGDYIGIAAYGGKAYVAWADNRITNPSELWQIYVSEIDYSGFTSYTTVPNNLIVNGPVTINSGAAAVYRGVNPVVVTTNNSTFQTLSGSHVDISSCVEVNLTDGFSAQDELHAYITCQTCYTFTPDGGGRLSANNNGGNPSVQSLKNNFSETQLGTDVKASIFPNPSTGLIYLNISAQNAGNVVTTITDIDGRIVANNNYNAEAGANNFKLDLSNLQNGVYTIRISDSAHNIIKRDKIILTK